MGDAKGTPTLNKETNYTLSRDTSGERRQLKKKYSGLFPFNPLLFLPTSTFIDAGN